MAIAIIGITMTAFVMTMSRLNESASITRNATGASTVLQNQIDLLVSDGPFNPQKNNSDGTPQIPPELVLGTHVVDNAPIYREPATGIVVSGTVTTTSHRHERGFVRHYDAYLPGGRDSYVYLSEPKLYR